MLNIVLYGTENIYALEFLKHYVNSIINSVINILKRVWWLAYFKWKSIFWKHFDVPFGHF